MFKVIVFNGQETQAIQYREMVWQFDTSSYYKFGVKYEVRVRYMRTITKWIPIYWFEKSGGSVCHGTGFILV